MVITNGWSGPKISSVRNFKKGIRSCPAGDYTEGCGKVKKKKNPVVSGHSISMIYVCTKYTRCFD